MRTKGKTTRRQNGACEWDMSVKRRGRGSAYEARPPSSSCSRAHIPRAMDPVAHETRSARDLWGEKDAKQHLKQQRHRRRASHPRLSDITVNCGLYRANTRKEEYVQRKTTTSTQEHAHDITRSEEMRLRASPHEQRSTSHPWLWSSARSAQQPLHEHPHTEKTHIQRTKGRHKGEEVRREASSSDASSAYHHSQ